MSSNAENRRRAVMRRPGRNTFDLLLTGAQIVDMVTGEIREADVGITGEMIASVHPRGARRCPPTPCAGWRLPVAGADGYPCPSRVPTSSRTLRGNCPRPGNHRGLLGPA